MKQLKLYIGSTVIYATLFVLLILIGLQILISLITQLGDIGQGDYHVWQALEYVILTLPAAVYQFFPMAGLMGCLLGLGYLASSHELIVMRTAGVSVWQVVWSVLRAAIILLFFATLIGEGIGPVAKYVAQKQKAIAKSGGQALSMNQGVWMRKNGTFIFINNIASSTQLFDITQYQFDSHNRLQVASYAKHAEYYDNQWWLDNVTETTFQNDKTVTNSFVSKPWSIKIEPALLKLSNDEPEDVSLSRLVQLMRYRRANGLQVQSFSLVFWQRVFQPFSSLVMIILAIPFIFGPLRSVSMGLRLVAGITISFLFYLLNRFFGPISLVYQIPPILSALLPSCLFLAIGVWLMRRTR